MPMPKQIRRDGLDLVPAQIQSLEGSQQPQLLWDADKGVVVDVQRGEATKLEDPFKTLIKSKRDLWDQNG